MNIQEEALVWASPIQWRRSSLCGNNACVEVAISNKKAFVRSSKETYGAYLVFDAAEWNAFLAGAQNHEFDID
jgi:hypothetical protein